MAGKGLRLYALANHLIATHAEREDGDAAAAAAALFAVTAKSLGGGGGVQANARDQLLRHHYSAMDRLREVSERLKAGEALPEDPPPSHVIQQATRLKELSRELRQFSGRGLASITSPRTARQMCRIFRLGDAAFEEWEAQQRGRGLKASAGKASASKGRRARTPSAKKSGKRKTPEKQPRSASRLAPDSSPVAAAAAAAQGVPQAQRRRSSEQEGEGSLVPKQLFAGGGECGADSPPAVPRQQASQPAQQQQQQPCEEWAAFKAFMASPRRPPATSSAAPTAAATPQAAERPQQAEQQAQHGQQQAMEVDSSQRDSSAAATAPAEVAEEPQAGPATMAAVSTAGSPASKAGSAPLSPKQGALSGPPPDLTPEKLLPAPGLYSSPIDKENGCSLSSWAWGCSPEGQGPDAWPALDATAAAAAVPANRSRQAAAVRRGLLVLQSPATERAAAAREQMAAEAADVLAADVLRLLSESDLALSSDDSQASAGGTAWPEGADGDTACSAARPHAASPSASQASSACSGEGSGSPAEAAPQAGARRQPGMQPLPADAPPRRTLIICASNRLFEFDAAATKAAAAATEVHAGGGLEVWMTRHNLNAAGRAHSIMRPIALPAVV